MGRARGAGADVTDAVAVPNGGRRIGGVSSFGFSGTNVHMLLEQAPQPPADTAATAPERHAHVIALSARSEAALTTLAASYAKHLRASEDSLASVAFTLNAGRAHFAHRAAFMARSKPDALGALERLADGDTDVAAAGVARGRAPRIAFLSRAKGHSTRAWLADCSSRSRSSVPRSSGATSCSDRTFRVRCCPSSTPSPAMRRRSMTPSIRNKRCLHRICTRDTLDVVGCPAHDGPGPQCRGGGGGMRRRRLQPRRCTEVSCVARQTDGCAPAQWRHGIGACNAGAGDGGPRPLARRIGIAAVNGSKNIVISGLLSSLKLATARLTAAGMKCTELNVSHAFHSPLMQPMLADFKRTLASIAFSPPRCDLVSTVTGRPIGAEVASAAYWSDQVQAAVQFEPAVQSVAKAGCDVFLEVGPQPTLLSMARQCASNDGIVWLPSLRRGKDDWAQMLESLAALYAQGVDIDWLAFDFAHRHLRVTLPGYPFHRERFWVNSPVVTSDVEMPAQPSTASAARAGGAAIDQHGAAVRVAVRSGAASLP